MYGFAGLFFNYFAANGEGWQDRTNLLNNESGWIGEMDRAGQYSDPVLAAVDYISSLEIPPSLLSFVFIISR